MQSLAGVSPASRWLEGTKPAFSAAAARCGSRAGGGIRRAAAAPAPARRSLRVAAEVGPTPSAGPPPGEMAEYIALQRTSEELSSIKGRMAVLQAALQQQLAAVEATQGELQALAAASSSSGGTRAAAEASLYSAVAGGEAARLRRQLAQQLASVDGTLSEMRVLEAQLDEAKAGRTAAYAAKLAVTAAAIAAKHAGGSLFAPGELLLRAGGRPLGCGLRRGIAARKPAAAAARAPGSP